MLKRGIGVALLCIAGQAYGADIVVTTTEDIEKDDKECSLREAIEYINREAGKEGYLGCGGENSTTTILLKANNTYVLNKHIPVKKSLTIRSVAENDGNWSSTEQVRGRENARIQMKGTDNLFRIANNENWITATLKELDLEGCGAASCAEEGGLIYNQGRLSLEHSRLFKGAAIKGGAIYSAGQFGDNLMSSVIIKNSLIENNKAQQGGILYTKLPFFFITQSVLRDNQTSNLSSANIYTAGQVADLETIERKNAEMSSSTLLKNSGVLINVVDGMGLNNLTIVDNADTALRLEAPHAKAYVANSIILKNGAQDCQITATDKTTVQNNLVGSCGTGEARYPNQIWTGTHLFAEKSNQSEGVCQNFRENTTAILCPYSIPKDQFLGYIRPRILLSHAVVEDSPIVNKGLPSHKVDSEVIGCAEADQRTNNRLMDNQFCDRGAIEVIVPTSMSLVGQDLLKGEVAKFSIQPYLGDSDLLPKEQCSTLVGPPPSGQSWQDGCLRIVQTKTESKGKTTIDLEGNVTYTPDSGWHGADIFEIQVVTSSTRFNKSKPYLVLSTQIVQEPKNEMQDKSVKTSGGAWGFGGLIALLGLIGLQRSLKD